MFLSLVVVAIVVGFLGYSKWSAIRTASRVVSFILFAIFAIVAGLSVYGSIALGGKGGGVLIFLAAPCAFLAWLSFSAFSSSRANEGYFDLNVDAKIAHNQTLIDTQVREHEATIAANTKKLEGFWLTPGKRRRLRDELAHSRFMAQRLAAMKSSVANPEIYRDDEA